MQSEMFEMTLEASSKSKEFKHTKQAIPLHPLNIVDKIKKYFFFQSPISKDGCLAGNPMPK